MIPPKRKLLGEGDGIIFRNTSSIMKSPEPVIYWFYYVISVMLVVNVWENVGNKTDQVYH